MQRLSPFFLFLCCLVLVITACNQYPRGEKSDWELHLSSDTILFDTIISQHATTTQSFRIINTNNHSITITSIQLKGGVSSFFRLNVDGIPCKEISDLELESNDSIFVFVEATFPNFNVDSACFHQDDVMISTQQSTQQVTLLSWSQDVFLKSGILSPDEIWKGKRPYLVKDSIQISYNEMLTIKEGVRIFFHKDAYMKILGGLHVEGTLESPVFFQGDRFDKTSFGDEYEHEPSQWSGLLFYPFSLPSEINYAVIKNGINGIYVLGSTDYDGIPRISIKNSIIKNHSSAGIISFGAELDCSNTFISNCYECILLYVKGKYRFNHVTVSNYYKHKVRQAGSVHISNYFRHQIGEITGEYEQIEFTNSIIYGNMDDEFTFNLYSETNTLNCNLVNCLLKAKDETLLLKRVNHQNLIFNEEPLLTNRETKNYMYPDTLSPFIDKASVQFSTQIPFDLLGNSRFSDGKPDLGAIEFQK